jgi:hypothetical protein
VNVAIDICGHVRTWRVGEAGRLENWLEQAPWNHLASPLGVRLARPLEPELLSAIRGEVYRVSSGTQHVRIDELVPTSPSDTPASLLWAWMSIPPSTKRALVEQLAELAVSSPRLLILRMPDESPRITWFDELVALSDLHQKLPTPGALAFLLVAPAGSDLPGACRLDRGWPTETASISAERDRWSAYVHERVAWHTAGALEHATELGRSIERLPIGGDGAVEDALDAQSDRLLGALDPHLLAELGASLAPIEQEPDLQHGPMGQSGADTRAIRPASWLARALLRQYPQHPMKRYLALLQVCRPLANRLLGRCTELEHVWRDRLLAGAPDFTPGDEAKRNADRLERRPDAIEHMIAPRGRCVIPEPRDIESFGGVIKSCGQAGTPVRDLHQLREMRNALAHGAEVGWGALRLLDRLEGSLR